LNDSAAIPEYGEGICLLYTCHAQPLIAAEATTFVLIQKVAKNQVSRKASLPHRPLPRKSGKTWAAIFLPCCRYALWPLPFCKNLLCPAFAHRAIIVLSDFTRSCSTDGKKEKKYYLSKEL